MILSIANQKGGVGKTTTSITLASALARKGKKVLLIDIDPQTNSSQRLLPKVQLTEEQTIYTTIYDKNPLQVFRTYIDNLHIVPSHLLLAGTDTPAMKPGLHHKRLHKRLQEIIENYDDVIIDCPPTLSILTINALFASDKVLIVVSPSFDSLVGIGQLLLTVDEVVDEYEGRVDVLGYLFVMADNTIASKDTYATLRQRYGDKVFNTLIPRNTAIEGASSARVDIYTYSPNSPAAQAYLRFMEEAKL